MVIAGSAAPRRRWALSEVLAIEPPEPIVLTLWISKSRNAGAIRKRKLF